MILFFPNVFTVNDSCTNDASPPRAVFFFLLFIYYSCFFLPNKNNVSSAVCCMCTNGILFVYARVPIFLNFYRRLVLYGPIVNVSH